MKYSIAIVSTLAATAFAAPAPATTSAAVPIFGPKNPVVNSICPALPKEKKGPLPNDFPISHQLGSIIGPALKKTIGADTVEDIDKIADQLCVSSMRSGEGNGICQDTFAAANAFVQAKVPLLQAKQFGCLLHLICLAPTGPTQPGTCNKLFGESDCIANTLVGVKPTECGKKPTSS